MNSYRSTALAGTAGGLIIAMLSPHTANAEVSELNNQSRVSPIYQSSSESESASGTRPYGLDGEADINSRYMEVITSFYESLMSSQEMLGPEIEDVVFSNISSLYIE